MKEDFVSWASVNNWIPLVAMAVSLALTFGANMTKQAILEQKIDSQNGDIIEIKQAQKEILAILKDGDKTDAELAIRLSILESKLSSK